MTEEERAEMEAASEADKATATGGSSPAPATAAAVPGEAHTDASSAPGPAVPGSTTTSAPVSEPAGTTTDSSLAHHSSFSSQATPSGSSSDLSKKDQGKDAKKTKPKLTPEQKAQLDALEAKREEQKKARSVESIATMAWRLNLQSRRVGG